MASLLIYILKWALCLAVLYIPFTLLLRKETFASLNRKLLLCAVALSALLPLLVLRFTIEVEEPVTANAALLASSVSTAMPSSSVSHSEPATIEPGKDELHSIMEIITWGNAAILYLVGLTAALLWEIAGVIRIRQAIARGTIWRDKRDGITVHCHGNDTAPFSWFSHVVISQHDYDECGKEILLHEEGHIRHSHSWDMLFIGIVKTLQWFNPFIYMLSNDIKEIHEYEADRYVLRHHSDAAAYQLLLLKKASPGGMFPLANNFSQSSVRRRITMMVRKRSSRGRYAKWLYLLPMSAACTAIFAQPEYVYIARHQAMTQQEAAGTTPPTAGTGGEIAEESTQYRHIPAEQYTSIPYSNKAASLPAKIAHIEFPAAKEGELRHGTFYEYINLGTSSSGEELKACGIRKCDIKVRFTANADGRASNIAISGCNIIASGGATPADIEQIKAFATTAATHHIATKQWHTGYRTIYDAYIVFHHGPESSIPGDNSSNRLMIGATAIK